MEKESRVDPRIFLKALEAENASVHVFPASVRWAKVERAFTDELDFALYGTKGLKEAMSDARTRAEPRYIPPASKADYISMAIVAVLALGLITWRFVRNKDNGTAIPARQDKGA